MYFLVIVFTRVFYSGWRLSKLRYVISLFVDEIAAGFFLQMNDDPFELDSCDSEVSFETDYSLRHFRARVRPESFRHAAFSLPFTHPS